MTKNKKIIIPIIVSAALVLVLSITSVVAYMFKKSPEIINKFFPALVSCEVNETFVNNENKTSVTVKNTGNIESYLRVRVVVHWQDSKGNIVARPVPNLEFTTDDKSGNGVFRYNADDWIFDAANNTFYYKSPVAVDGSTANLLKIGTKFQGVVLESVEVTSSGGVKYTYYPVIEFVAEAIQAKSAGGGTAVVEAWGVTLDGNRKITNVN